MVMQIDSLAEQFRAEGYSEAAARLKELGLTLKEQELIPQNIYNTPIPIEVLYRLNVRTYNALKRSGIVSVEELEAIPDSELIHFTNIGFGSIANIRSSIAGFRGGASLEDSTREEYRVRRDTRKINIQSIVDNIIPAWQELDDSVPLDQLRNWQYLNQGRPPMGWISAMRKLTGVEKAFVTNTLADLLDLGRTRNWMSRDNPYSTVGQLRTTPIEELSTTPNGRRKSQARVAFLQALLQPQPKT